MITKILKSEVLWASVIIFIGAFLRLYRLDQFPVGLHGDEAWTGIEAVRILRDGFIGFWSSSSYGNPALVYYFTAFIFSVWGKSIITLRFSLAILNVLWLPFFYLTIKNIFNRQVALISTFLLATGYVPLAFSRKAELLALNFAFFPSLFFSLRAAQTGRLRHYLLAGIFLGLNLHTNQPFWLTPIIVIGVFLVWFAVTRKFTKNFIFLIIGFLVIALPILKVGLSPQGPLLARFQTIIITSPESHYHSLYLSQYATAKSQFVHNLIATSLAFWSREDLDIRDYFYHGPTLDPLSRVLFIIGVAAGPFLFKRQKGKVFLIYLLFLIFLFGSVLTVDAPNTRRMQPSIYISYVFVGLGLYAILQTVRSAPVFVRKIAMAIVVVAIIGIGIINTGIYFNSSQSPDAKSIMAFQLTEIAKYVSSQPNPYVYFYSDRWPYDYETLRFLLADVPGEDRSNKFGQYSVINTSASRNSLYIFLPEYTSSLVEATNLYPDGISQNHFDRQGNLLFTSYQLKI